MNNLLSFFFGENKKNIELKTSREGLYNIIINTHSGNKVFEDSILSKNKKIVLKGFSPQEHTITLIPIIMDYNF